jgi:FtsP/CotA-like multicopper oxidase with cupredoxin domain
MSKILNTAAAIVVLSLGLAAVGPASAKLRPFRAQPGYAGPVSSSASSTGWQFVPGRGIVGESCDLPTSACSNDNRPN